MFGLDTENFGDNKIETIKDKNLERLHEHETSSVRRRQHNDKINVFKKKMFSSLNSLIGWLVTAASTLFCILLVVFTTGGTW